MRDTERERKRWFTSKLVNKKANRKKINRKKMLML